MTAGRLLRASFALLVAFGTQAAHGAPIQAVRSLRAVSCCATHCKRPLPPRAASECCGARTVDDTATLGAAPSLREPAAACVALLPVSFAGRTAWAQPASEPTPHARGAPLFLLTRNLRI